MITCTGLIVGTVESPYAQDLINQCAKWLKSHRYLLNEGLIFKVEKLDYFTVIDYFEENNEVFILCRLYDGSTKMGTSK